MTFIADTCVIKQLMNSRVIWLVEFHTRLILVRSTIWLHRGILLAEIRKLSCQWRRKWCLILIWTLMMTSERAALERACARNVGRTLMLRPSFLRTRCGRSLISPIVFGYSPVEEVSIAGFAILKRETCPTRCEQPWLNIAVSQLATSSQESWS